MVQILTLYAHEVRNAPHYFVQNDKTWFPFPAYVLKLTPSFRSWISPAFCFLNLTPFIFRITGMLYLLPHKLKKLA